MNFSIDNEHEQIEIVQQLYEGSNGGTQLSVNY